MKTIHYIKCYVNVFVKDEFLLEFALPFIYIIYITNKATTTKKITIKHLCI